MAFCIGVGKMEQKKYFTAQSIRLMRFLYSLGFVKQSVFDEAGKESWQFEYSSDLQESLDFYFAMRSKITGVDDNGKRKNLRNLQD